MIATKGGSPTKIGPLPPAPKARYIRKNVGEGAGASLDCHLGGDGGGRSKKFPLVRSSPGRPLHVKFLNSKFPKEFHKVSFLLFSIAPPLDRLARRTPPRAGIPAAQHRIIFDMRWRRYIGGSPDQTLLAKRKQDLTTPEQSDPQRRKRTS